MLTTTRDVKELDWPWPNFSPDEPVIACPCCGELWYDKDFFNKLQRLRDLMGRPLRVNSCHRCGIHNARVGGVPLSQHRKAAADVSTIGHDRFLLLECGIKAGFGSFGLYQTFIHMDRRRGRLWFGGKRSEALWSGARLQMALALR